MSSEVWTRLAAPAALAALVGWLGGCAGFSRGEYWDADTGDEGPAEGGDGADGDDDDDDDDDDDSQDDDDDDDDDDPTGGADSGGSEGGSGDIPDGPSFEADVLPVLIAGCDRCHGADGEASDTAFLVDLPLDEIYADTLTFVDLTAPDESRLLAKTAGVGHTGGVIYDSHSSQYALILDWIEHGALP